MKVGLFGGTFDPIHMGHLIIAEGARSRLALDEVLFVPAGQPWLKEGMKITEGRHRLAMVSIAVRSNPSFRVSDVEIERPGPSYTVDTLAELKRCLAPAAAIYLILGLDSLREIGRWRKPQRIFDMARVVGVSRPGANDFGPDEREKLEKEFPGASAKLVLLNGPRIGISGVELRRRLSAGQSVRYQVPEPVETYIREHGLYLTRSESE